MASTEEALFYFLTPLFCNGITHALGKKEDEDHIIMGQRHNRKRVRHRPNRARRGMELEPSPIQPTITQFSSMPTALSVRYSYAPAPHAPVQTSKQSTNSSLRQSKPGIAYSQCREENALSRDLRIFGGLEHELQSSDLRGPMLDVVLGLFNGIDYDDASC